MANPGYDKEKMERLGKLLVKKPHTARQLSAMYKKTTVAIKRMISNLPRFGFTVKKEFAEASGKVGRRPLVFTATSAK